MSDRERIYRLERQIEQMQVALDRLAVRESTSMPYRQVRIGKAVKNGETNFPVTGTTFFAELQDGGFTQATGTSATYATRGTTVLACSLSGSLPSENDIVALYEWNGTWWAILVGDQQPPDPGSLSRVFVEMEFSNTTPDTLVAPGAGFTGSDPYVEIDWTNSTVDGTHSGISADPSTGEITYSTGDYLLDIFVRGDTTNNESSQSVYTSGAESGHPVRSGARVHLQKFDGSSWSLYEYASSTAYAGPDYDSYGTSVFLRYKISVSDPTQRFRIVVGHMADIGHSDDGQFRIYHCLWMSQPLSA